PIAAYAPALARGWTAGTVIDDAPIEIPIRGSAPYFPRNYDLKFLGLMTMREALRTSRNVPAIKVLTSIGIESGIEMARQLGIDSLDTDPSDGVSDLNPTLALGGLTYGVSVLDMAAAYATFANGGVYSEPYAIRRVVDRYGNVVLENRPQQRVVLEPEVAWVLTDMLRNVIYPHRIGRAGTGYRAALAGGRPAAGKTGTTDDYYDVWFVGYTPELTTAVWIGHDEPREMRGETSSGTHPAWIWKRIMDGALADLPVKDFTQPDNIVRVRICKQTGLLPSPYCPDSEQYTEVFVRGTEPTEVGQLWQPATVCREDPTVLYQPGCGCTPMERVFLNRPRVEPVTRTVGGRTQTYTVEDMALAPPTATCEARPGAGQSGRAEIRIHRDALEPMVIWDGARAGEPFTLVVTAADAAAVLRIEELGLEASLEAGETRQLQFVPERAGVFSIEVDVDNKTLYGRLVVREGSGEGGGAGSPPNGGASGEDDRRGGSEQDDEQGRGGEQPPDRGQQEPPPDDEGEDDAGGQD
ncbi:MAG TPA: penicillin-binding transpeptidase domain-containing protein, partial [Bacillota bacterium]